MAATNNPDQEETLNVTLNTTLTESQEAILDGIKERFDLYLKDLHNELEGKLPGITLDYLRVILKFHDHKNIAHWINIINKKRSKNNIESAKAKRRTPQNPFYLLYNLTAETQVKNNSSSLKINQPRSLFAPLYFRVFADKKINLIKVAKEIIGEENYNFGLVPYFQNHTQKTTETFRAIEKYKLLENSESYLQLSIIEYYLNIVILFGLKELIINKDSDLKDAYQQYIKSRISCSLSSEEVQTLEVGNQLLSTYLLNKYNNTEVIPIVNTNTEQVTRQIPLISAKTLPTIMNESQFTAVDSIIEPVRQLDVKYKLGGIFQNAITEIIKNLKNQQLSERDYLEYLQNWKNHFLYLYDNSVFEKYLNDIQGILVEKLTSELLTKELQKIIINIYVFYVNFLNHNSYTKEQYQSLQNQIIENIIKGTLTSIININTPPPVEPLTPNINPLKRKPTDDNPLQSISLKRPHVKQASERDVKKLKTN